MAASFPIRSLYDPYIWSIFATNLWSVFMNNIYDRFMISIYDQYLWSLYDQYSWSVFMVNLWLVFLINIYDQYLWSNFMISILIMFPSNWSCLFQIVSINVLFDTILFSTSSLLTRSIVWICLKRPLYNLYFLLWERRIRCHFNKADIASFKI